MVSFNENDPVRAKVADFGLSRIVAPSIHGVLDTWQWLAPEVIGVIESKGKSGSQIAYGCPSDVYSFGICCWELATCGNPFQEYEKDTRFCRENESGQTHFAEPKVKRAIYTESLRPTLPKCKEIPEEFLKLIQQCWQTNIEQRPTFGEIIKKIESLLCISSPLTKKLLISGKLQTLNRNMKGKNLNLRGPFLEKDVQKKSLNFNIVTNSTSQSIISDNLKSPSKSLITNTDISPTKIINLPMKLRCECICLKSPYSSSSSLNNNNNSGLLAPLDHSNQQIELWIGCTCGIIVVIDPILFSIITHWHAHDVCIECLEQVENSVWSATSDGSLAIWNSSVSFFNFLFFNVCEF